MSQISWIKRRDYWRGFQEQCFLWERPASVGVTFWPFRMFYMHQNLLYIKHSNTLNSRCIKTRKYLFPHQISFSFFFYIPPQLNIFVSHLYINQKIHFWFIYKWLTKISYKPQQKQKTASQCSRHNDRANTSQTPRRSGRWQWAQTKPQ